MSDELWQAPHDVLDEEHNEILDRVIRNVLSTDLAEFNYAQILGGLPTLESFEDSYIPLANHPVYVLNHDKLCEGSLEKARSYRSRFYLSELRFEPAVLRAFQAILPGSTKYNLRLIELVVVACHQIGAHLYDLDEGIHKHDLHQKWLETERLKLVDNRHPNGYPLPLSAFFHMAYRYPEQYPRGVADVAGYWAESKIFGGVIVFDRGESEKECNSIWIHGGFIGGPQTLYPPTQEQFDKIVCFLLASLGQNYPCPLHVRGSWENRPRWDPYDAFVTYHIFRDRYERKVAPGGSSLKGHRQSTFDLPEMLDEYFLAQQVQDKYHGREVDKAATEAALKRLSEVTPSSPCGVRIKDSLNYVWHAYEVYRGHDLPI